MMCPLGYFPILFGLWLAGLAFALPGSGRTALAVLRRTPSPSVSFNNTTEAIALHHLSVDGDGDEPVTLLDVDKEIDRLGEIGLDTQELRTIKSNWQKTKDLVTSGLAKKKEIQSVASAAFSGVKQAVEQAERGDTGSATASLLSMGSKIAAVIPGGAPVAFALSGASSLISLIFGKGTAPPPEDPTKQLVDQIKDAVSEALWDHEFDWAGSVEIPKLVREVHDSVLYWTTELDRRKNTTLDVGKAQTYARQMEKDMSNDVLNDHLGDIPWLIKKKAEEIDAKGKKQNMCIETCALMISPVEAWAANHDSPDLSVYSNLRSWRFAFGNDDISGRESWPEFRACWARHMAWNGVFSQATAEAIQPCVDRVWDLDGCRSNFRDAAPANFADVEKFVSQYQILGSMLHTLMKIWKIWFEEVSIEGSTWTEIQLDPQITMRRVSSLWKDAIFRSVGWSMDNAKFFFIEGEKFECNNDATDVHDFPWLKHAGGPNSGYDENFRLRNQPCATNSYCEDTARHTCHDGPCAPEVTCDAMGSHWDAAKDQVDWGWNDAVFNYSNVIAQFSAPGDFNLTDIFSL
uniref:Uncharacterized protein n=1 Tax=Chromera velia CCMP2878 TaxID=1169474 RepID=A0A0G4GXJ6_9ALVE|eukprot:Cvel_23751.t1-p1 / transcript=Cvel_23751.t1 / gene=Cvel_23751 / organism=Chromera_velia_CCMP2878 / gene_product=hypothetical protein / transcript_product=hypothetical protein / location=Cvel_scaffold2488:5559-9871(-) / protein_length=574 / sequence_SO=supercontig / SO=protein_coding / is_pseudo=false